MTIILRTEKRKKNTSDSEYGLINVFLMVGTKPKTSTVVRIITAHRGSEVKNQKGKDEIADIKNTQSVFVIVMSVLRKKANKAMNIVITPDTPIGHAPTPPLASNCARKTINVVMPHINQEKTCGFVVPFRIEFI
ncbi:MAG: hypothetical protein QM500_00650 [Methylococcales bacterium]